MPDSLDDIRWLATVDAAAWFERLAQEADMGPKLVVRLRKELSIERTHLLLKQVELRKRATDKFPHAADMLFTRRGLEQSTDAHTARFKAERFPADGVIHDLCCGIGGDSIALARRTDCRAIDRDPIMTFLAEHNANACGARGISSNCDDVSSDTIATAIGNNDHWHIDPDRRSAGRRHSRVEGYQPGIDVLHRLTEQGRGGAMKLAPAADLPSELNREVELEWISRGGECKQLVAWYGAPATSNGQRTASVLNRKGDVAERFTAEPVVGEVDTAKAIGKYVFDPDAALLAAKLVEPYSQHSGLTLVDRRSCYLTGDSLQGGNAIAAFEVLDVMPMDVRRLRQALATHDMGRIEWKKRSVDVELPKLAAKCKAKGDLPGVVIVSAWQGRTVAIICRRP